MSGVGPATKDLTRRLSQAASGAGPAAEALGRQGFSAAELLTLPLDERVGPHQPGDRRLRAGGRARGGRGQLFGEEGSIAMARIDTATLRQATQDVHDFDVVVSEADADRVERANDAISRLGLIGAGSRTSSPRRLPGRSRRWRTRWRRSPAPPCRSGSRSAASPDDLGRLVAYAATFAGIMAGRWVAGLVAAAVSVRGLATALVVLRRRCSAPASGH